MQALEANITATCPTSFTGITGNLFLKAVTSVLAAHCGILDDYTWPRDISKEILENETVLSFDFIIVGAGTAGSLLASQLKLQFPNWSILLIEAGSDPGIDNEIPAFLFLNQNSTNDWSYKTHPDGNSCLGFRDKSCIWSKGKGLGGSSSINAMIYLRGHPKDYLDWESSGNTGWSYKDLKHYFDEQEQLFNITDTKFPGYENDWYDNLDRAWGELGFSCYNYNSHEASIGTKKARILTQNGKRMNTAKTYFKNARKLLVMKNTEVIKLLLNRQTKKILGVQIKHISGKVIEVAAKREVVLSAGSIGTPHLLMLSGIGPKSLKDNNIDYFMNLEVGKNLQDHFFFPLFLKTNFHRTLSRDDINIFLIQYMLTNTGPFSNIGITDYMGFISTNNSSEYPDIQYHYFYFPKNDSFVLKTYFHSVGYKNEIIHEIEKLNSKHDLLGIYPTLLTPKSRGEVLLSKSLEPIIKANYLKNPQDLFSLLKAIDFVHDLENTTTFKKLGLELLHLKIPNCNKYTFNSEAFWECYIRHMGTTIYHPVGTTKMGPVHDETSVVNNKLLVHGLKNLRVVDASIMPTIPRANTMAATLVIARKAVDIIREQYSINDEL